MPIFTYFAAVGSVLVALMFVADAALEKHTAPVVATSSLYGLPKAWHADPAQNLAATAAPAPDLASEAVVTAMPKTEPVNERSAAADPAPKKKRVAHKQPQTDDYRQSFAWSPAPRNQFGGSGGFFGRF